MDTIKNITNTKCRKCESVWIISIALLSFMFFSYAFSVISFYLDFSINKYIFPSAIIAVISMGLFLDSGSSIYRKIIWMATVLIIITMCIFLANLVYDQSYDGLRYHQEIISTLCDGWNPHKGKEGIYAPPTLWSLHYAKAVEIVEASIACFTGRMEAGKGINLIIIASAAFGVYAFLRSNPTKIFLKNKTDIGCWSKKKSLWVTIAIIGNPVVLSQWLIFYIDFYKYIYLIMVLLAFYLIKSSESYGIKGYIILVMSLVLAMGTKFNFFFEAGVWMILAFVWLIFTRSFLNLRKLVIVSLCALCIGTLLAYHPYITNLIENGHPLYPLMGEGSVDIMTSNTPDKYIGHNRVVNFFMSLFSMSMPNYDQREGGFSILMPFILILSVFIAWRERSSLRSIIWYISVCIFLSCFFFDQTWWARYICQLWLLGGIFLIASQCNNNAKTVGKIMSVLMVSVSLLATSISLSVSITRGNYLRFLFEACKEEPVIVAGELPSHMRRHLEEERISYERVAEVPDDKSMNALNYYYHVSPVLILSTRQITEIDNKLNRFGQSVERYRYVPSESRNEDITNE